MKIIKFDDFIAESSKTITKKDLEKVRDNKRYDLSDKKITKKTYDDIKQFLYDNKDKLSYAEKAFYSDVQSMIDLQLRKKAQYRMTMDEIIDRVVNAEEYIMAAGGDSLE